jgi:transposase
VIETVKAGASRRETAELYGIGPSVVVIWVRRWKETGSILAKPSGGSISALEEHAEFLFGLASEQLDLTLDEILAKVSKAGIATSRTALLRFYERAQVQASSTPRPGIVASRAVPRVHARLHKSDHRQEPGEAEPCSRLRRTNRTKAIFISEGGHQS